MKELFLKFKNQRNLSLLNYKELAYLSQCFYQTATKLHPEQVAYFYDQELKSIHENIQNQAAKVLKSYHYNLFPELGVIQFISPTNELTNESLIDVAAWLKDSYEELDESFLLKCGFWLEPTNYPILQVAQGIYLLKT